MPLQFVVVSAHTRVERLYRNIACELRNNNWAFCKRDAEEKELQKENEWQKAMKATAKWITVAKCWHKYSFLNPYVNYIKV